MIYVWDADDHTIAALREEAAADRATCMASARSHNVLANLYRAEAAKLNAVQTTVTLRPC